MAKKKIGFIDLHIDEWHANNYPAWFSASRHADGFELGYAWEESPNPDGKPLAEWCAQFNMTPAKDIAEVIEKSDAICVLAPSNPEAHARLSDLALRSGKPLYIDKTFAPDRATAEGFFALAEQHGTPLMSSSALRYGEELVKELTEGKFGAQKPTFVSTTGGGSSFQEYAIHQIEMIVSALGTGARSVTRLDCATSFFTVKYADGVRGASISYNRNLNFYAVLGNPSGASLVLDGTRMFEHLLDHILEFYTTGVSPIPKEQTIEVAAIREAALKADANPGVEIML